MPVPLPVRRLALRLAYQVIALVWRVLRVRPDGVKCIIIDGERLLLVRHTYGPSGWDLPGGARRRREPPARTAEREMREELGLHVPAAAWRDLGELASVRGSHRIRVLATELRDPPLRPDDVEIAQAAWWDRHRLPEQAGPLLAPILRGASPYAFNASGHPSVTPR